MISISDNVIHGFKAIVLLSSFLGNLVSSSNLLPDNSGMPSICRIISIEEEGGEVVEKTDSQREIEREREGGKARESEREREREIIGGRESI